MISNFLYDKPKSPPSQRLGSVSSRPWEMESVTHQQMRFTLAV
ncbi:MAG: hypothetical protein PHX74_10080 [Candidatus Sumerlaeales bacterium]|nr:hypothetical protein [Candidatus Sumerlaeales bacterium]